MDVLEYQVSTTEYTLQLTLKLLLVRKIWRPFHLTSTSDRARKALLTIISITILSPGLRGDHILEEERVVCCPDHTVVLTCTATFVDGLEWAVAPYIPKEDAIKFVINLHAGDFMPVHHKDFLARVTNLSRLNPTTARFMTSTLEVNCSRISNGTIVECITSRNDSIHSVTAAVHHAGVPKWVGNTNTHHTMDPVVLDLGEMFDGGGVPIDYIIELDNGTQLETDNFTYSIDIMFSTTLSVNISAHNCAGYSPFFPLVLQYIPDVSFISMLYTTATYKTIINVTPTTGLPEVVTPKKTPSFQNTFILPLSIGIVVLILFTLVIITVFFYICRYVKKRAAKNAVISVNETSEHYSERTPNLPLYSYVPVRRNISSDQNITDQHPTFSSGIDTSQNFIGIYAELQPTGTYTEVEPSQSTVLPPPSTGNDTVQYTMPDVSKLVEKERKKKEVFGENVVLEPRKDYLSTLDKEINAHLILLQLRSVRESWHALGQAAGMDLEMLNSVDEELSDDGGKLAEVVFYWVERMKKVYWSDVAQLCEQIGFNQISEAINNAYVTGVLPVQDTPDVAPFTTEAILPPTLTPHISDDDEKGPPVPTHQGRRCGENTVVPTMVLQGESSDETLSCDREYDEGSPPPPPLPPPMAAGDIDF